jgi:hypothetical protein
MSSDSAPVPPSGLTINGVAVPMDVESAGPDAIAAHVAAATSPAPVPSVPESAENPPTDDEGAES